MNKHSIKNRLINNNLLEGKPQGLDKPHKFNERKNACYHKNFNWKHKKAIWIKKNDKFPQKIFLMYLFTIHGTKASAH